jgi:GMP synthase (glutamine-hydrolysing)
MIEEITAQALDIRAFITDKVKEIADTVGGGTAINALSGGVDSSTVTMLGHRALGERLRTVFVDNGLMREGEPERVVGLFRALGVPVEVVDAQKEFLTALWGIPDPEEKREAITRTFYRHVFGRLVKASGARSSSRARSSPTSTRRWPGSSDSTTCSSSSASTRRRRSATASSSRSSSCGRTG